MKLGNEARTDPWEWLLYGVCGSLGGGLAGGLLEDHIRGLGLAMGLVIGSVLCLALRRPLAAAKLSPTSHKGRAKILLLLSSVLFTFVFSFSAVYVVLSLAFSDRERQEDCEVRITLLHMNDVYEIFPLGSGETSQGGLARVATLRQRLLADNRNTLTLLAGDLFSPSALGTAEIEGQGRLAGRQIVDVMNRVGLDIATLGNHEFDLDEEQFRARISESSATWISSNVFQANGGRFPGVLPNLVLDFEESGGGRTRLGFFGLTLDSNRVPWVTYVTDYVTVAREQERILRQEKKADIVVALTHLALADDVKLAREVQGLDLILGGHEHDNVRTFRGTGFTPILKADANARTAYVHDLYFTPATKTLRVESGIRQVTADLPDERNTARAVQSWTELAFGAFRRKGIDPEEVLGKACEQLDGLEASVRYGRTALTDVIGHALLSAAPEADLALYNSGSIRIDDVIPQGQAVTAYDVLRILPFGGFAESAEVTGEVLARVLTTGAELSGQGAFIQVANVERTENGDWQVHGEPIDRQRAYRVASNDYVLDGKEKDLKFPRTEEIRERRRHSPLQEALIDELKKPCPRSLGS